MIIQYALFLKTIYCTSYVNYTCTIYHIISRLNRRHTNASTKTGVLSKVINNPTWSSAKRKCRTKNKNQWLVEMLRIEWLAKQEVTTDVGASATCADWLWRVGIPFRAIRLSGAPVNDSRLPQMYGPESERFPNTKSQNCGLPFFSWESQLLSTVVFCIPVPNWSCKLILPFETRLCYTHEACMHISR